MQTERKNLFNAEVLPVGFALVLRDSANHASMLVLTASSVLANIFAKVLIIPRFFVNLQPYLTINGQFVKIEDMNMAYTGRFGQSDDFHREELIRKIEHSVENLTLQKLEALYYDMSTKNYINE